MAQPVPEGLRLYGRRKGHTLRARQVRLMQLALPRLRYDPADAAWRHGFADLWLEIGFGGGEHAEAIARAHPEVALIAAEVYENGICSLLTRLIPEGEEHTAPPPPNLRLWPDDARPLLAALPAASLGKLFLLFPDPWPKTRHASRRFVGPATLALAARALRPGGEWRIATDDPTYQSWVTSSFQAAPGFDCPTPATTRPQTWPPTRYEAKALRAGRTPLYWTIRRQD